MRCPICDEALREVEKYRVIIDICPGCRGVWLDRGELEEILDMASAGGPVSEARNSAGAPGRQWIREQLSVRCPPAISS